MLSAISVARHVARERGEQIGESIGYAVRLDSSPPRWPAQLLYCTTGHLLRQLEGDRQLSNVGGEGSIIIILSPINAAHSMTPNAPYARSKTTHVIVDEAHERDMNSDFLLTVLKNMLETYVSHDAQCFMPVCGTNVFIS